MISIINASAGTGKTYTLVKNYLIEILRAIFNYPKIKNKNYDSLSRLKLMIFLFVVGELQINI